jgi:hypothetical protein
MGMSIDMGIDRGMDIGCVVVVYWVGTTPSLVEADDGGLPGKSSS